MDFKSKVMKIKVLLITLLCVFSWNNVSGQSDENKSMRIIGNNTGYEEMDKTTLNDAFRGRISSWITGYPAIIVLPSQKNPSSVLAAEQIYRTTTKGMQKFWLSLVFQGRANPPVFLDTDEEIIRYVAKNPGAIGVVYSSSAVADRLEIKVDI
jgi:ABC-type phosphate transport system substrate-binding protein